MMHVERLLIKVGKLLNLEYPGGPKVAQLAKSGNSEI